MNVKLPLRLTVEIKELNVVYRFFSTGPVTDAKARELIRRQSKKPPKRGSRIDILVTE